MRAVGLILAVLIPAAAFAQAPNITVAVDRQSVTVGDPIHYTLTVQYDSTLRLIAPAIGKTLGKFEILHDSTLADAKPAPGHKLYRRQLRLAAFETGQLWIAPLRGEAVDPTGRSTAWQSDSLLVTVASVLAGAATDTTDIHGLKAPYQVPQIHWWIWAAVVAILIGAAVIYWIRRKRHPLALAPAAPPIPAWDAALQSLRAMRQEIDPEEDGGRLWYFRLSEVLRRYFDQRYGWASIDETTTEVMQRLDSAPFDNGHRERAQEFFQLADQVRYAKHPAKVGRPEVDWEWVRGFVQSTIPVIAETPTPTPAPTGGAAAEPPTAQSNVDVVA